MASMTSYNNDKMVMGEVEYPAMDPASGAFFQPDYKKNEDLKAMLDGSKDSLKLEAMKRIIGMIAKGRDASDLFPAVVKNVVSKNMEVKKLVYVYLVRYAEEQQDLALLSISTFQRALKDPNQLIRACALRVLSSIRVPVIVPIVTLAIRDAASDMSPYVRKTAAHAIPKLYSLDKEQKEDLVELIGRLLADRAPLVVGSAAGAFSEVCEDRIDLIHPCYRKLCSLLTDVDEWGQLILLNVLTVYARRCFPDPNTIDCSDSEPEKHFYPSDSSDSPKRSSPSLDADHRLVLRAAKPLLQSRNSGVVMAVAQLFVHCAPAQELPPVAKALIRLLRAPVEVQSVVLNSIACLSDTRPGLFEPFLKSFFVRTSDPTHLKLLKLQILTNLATETSAPVVLRELHTYVTNSDKIFAAATVQAMGRLAASIPSQTDSCLRALLKLLSSKDERLVCESVVVIKRVVGLGCVDALSAVGRAARLLPAGSLAPPARAAALWLLAEHGAHTPQAASILAHSATTFADQDELVKLQLLSLAVKVFLTQPSTLPLVSYLLTLARYDSSYDVRDRARLLRRFVEPKEGSKLAQCKEYVFKPDIKKPAAQDTGKAARSGLTLGSLSQYLGAPSAGYRPLPAAPAATQGAQDREEDIPATVINSRTKDEQKNKKFYSEPESSTSDSESSSDSGSSGSEEEDEEESSNEGKKIGKPSKETNNHGSGSSSSGSSDSESDSEDSSEHSDSADDDDDDTARNGEHKGDGDDAKTPPVRHQSSKSNLELLLELESEPAGLPAVLALTPSRGTAPTAQGTPHTDVITPVGPSHVPVNSVELLSRVVSGGLSARGRFTRAPHLYSDRMCAVEVTLTNHTSDDLTDVRVLQKNAVAGRAVHSPPPLANLPRFYPHTLTLGVDFADSIQPVELTIACATGEWTVSLTPAVGELVRAVTMHEARWEREQRKLRGMNECDKKVAKLESDETVCRTIFETVNVAAVTQSGDVLRFAGRLMSSQELVLVSVRRGEVNDTVVANCGNMAIASMIANQTAKALDKASGAN